MRLKEGHRLYHIKCKVKQQVSDDVEVARRDPENLAKMIHDGESTKRQVFSVDEIVTYI